MSDEADHLLARIRDQLNLEAESEHHVLEEIRFHLDTAALEAQDRGLSKKDALIDAVERFGAPNVGQDLHEVHEGEGVA